MTSIVLAFIAALAGPAPLAAAELAVDIDVTAAQAVLAALRDPQLREDQALAIAGLPGNQGLIRKARSYGREASDLLFAKALVAAARQDTSFVDISRFGFDSVRGHADATAAALVELTDLRTRPIETVKQRIALFTPPNVTGRVVGHVVVGGTSGGFAFGDPEFFLNLDRFSSAMLASTIMGHELFHAVQAIARPKTPSEQGAACSARIAGSKDVADFMGALAAEGTASYVGDVLMLPRQGTDGATAKERARFARNVELVGRSITQLELSLHGLTTGAKVTPDEVYELGFYDDEVMYGLGYVMARAIAREQGNAAVARLIGLPGGAFVQQYTQLNAYGKSDDVPALKPATVRLAAAIMDCAKAGP